MVTFQRLFAEWCTREHRTPAEVAPMLGISPVTAQKYAAGQSVPALTRIHYFAERMALDERAVLNAVIAGRAKRARKAMPLVAP